MFYYNEIVYATNFLKTNPGVQNGSLAKVFFFSTYIIDYLSNMVLDIIQDKHITYTFISINNARTLINDIMRQISEHVIVKN